MMEGKVMGMNGYLLGLDGGGTKTVVNVADTAGNVLLTFTGGAINMNGESERNVAGNFAEIFKTAQSAGYTAENCRGFCIGTAGISNPKVQPLVADIVRKAGYPVTPLVVGDHQTALAGALDGMVGIILIAGTGSICYGVNAAGEEKRTGGFGYLIDDKGSGYAVGRGILQAVVRAYDGRQSHTLLTELVFDKLGITTMKELTGLIYKEPINKREIAALAPCLTAACERRDSAALAIVENAAAELVNMVAPVASDLQLSRGELATAGSVLLKDSFIRPAFLTHLATICPELTCITPRYDAAYGAVLLIKQKLLQR